MRFNVRLYRLGKPMIDGPTVALLTAVIPLLVGLWLNCRSTIVHALAWAVIAWGGWLGYALAPGMVSAYAALTLTGGAGIAVFGARRPGVIAWHFVVLTLVIVMWIGWAEGLLTGAELKLGPARLTFLSGVLALTVLNYLPTRPGVGAAFLGAGCGGLLVALWRGDQNWPRWPLFLVGIAPWLTYLGHVTKFQHGPMIDQRWRRFRDRFGVVWAQRLREQFHAAAKHNGWNVELHWDGLHGDAAPHLNETEMTITALEKRFWRDS